MTYLSRALVEPTTSEMASTGSSHSGCARISEPGCSSLRAWILRAEKVSWTMQLPCHRTMSRPVSLMR
ncbi:hypothetical protein D3C86_1596010 [compost metagenome]